MESKGITFIVQGGLKNNGPPNLQSSSKLMTNDDQGKLLKTSNNSNVRGSLGNGFVGSCFTAYNQHYNLVLSPDDVWVAITTSLASFIGRHSEEMRSTFVSHDGKKELTVYGIGNIHTADYDLLIHELSDLIDKETKGDIRTWFECDFTTSTPLTKTISKIVLMGAVKNYFEYNMMLMCGLPKVTLLGTIDDWRKIKERAQKLSTFNMVELTQWESILGKVLDHFISAFEGNVDKDWWNRIAHQTGGGSGPRYLEGWILAFTPWSTKGNFVLKDPDTNNNSYGRVNTNDVPASSVEVPVSIDDNGRKYKTLFNAGMMHSFYNKETNEMSPALDWAMYDVTQM